MILQGIFSIPFLFYLLSLRLFFVQYNDISKQVIGLPRAVRNSPVAL